MKTGLFRRGPGKDVSHLETLHAVGVDYRSGLDPEITALNGQIGLGPDLIEFPVQQVLLIGDARQHDHRGVYPGFRALLEFIQSINNGGFEWNIGKRDQGLGSRGDDLKGLATRYVSEQPDVGSPRTFDEARRPRIIESAGEPILRSRVCRLKHCVRSVNRCRLAG